MNLTKNQLSLIMHQAPVEVIDRYYQPLIDGMTKAFITTPLRVAHFLAQVGHETGDMQVVIENLNYSATGLLSTWPSKFTLATANMYAHNPEKIANYVYANHVGNGNIETGDGWKFRGRGFIQLTGRENYTAYGYARGADYITGTNPDLIASDPKLTVDVACWYWTIRNINPHADLDDILVIRRLVNGGLIGLDDCRNRLGLTKAVLGI
jgi:putative chitinase